MRLVLLRKAPPCPPFLRRSHPGSPSQRLGLHHTQLAHIGTDRCAIDVRRFTAGCLTRILVSVIWLGRRRTPGSDEDQHEQCSFHPGLSPRVAAACAPTASGWNLATSLVRAGDCSVHSGARAACEELYWMVVSLSVDVTWAPLSPERRNAFGSPNTSPATPVSAAAAKQQQ